LDTLTEREDLILELIVDHYIRAAEPVGSRTLEKSLKNRLSSATIRNVMADLEEKGFIYKPHIVAGRIPTHKAFRHYVNTMLTLTRPDERALQAIDRLQKPRYFHVERLMEDASRVLADASNYASIVVEPRIGTMLFKEVEFVKLSNQTILIVFVTSSGMVHTRLVETEENLPAETLESMKGYMNNRFSGRPFHVLKEAIQKDVRQDKESVNRLLARIKDTLDTIINDEDGREVYIEGTSQMITLPEFTDLERLKELFQALEKKEKLLRLLDHCLRMEGINVIIGMELDIREMRDMSVIASAYRLGEKSYGILGVIGPVRMDYSKVIPMVNYTARAVSNILSIM
jgi:heat-inducible transcriptional repressor